MWKVRNAMHTCLQHFHTEENKVPIFGNNKEVNLQQLLYQGVYLLLPLRKCFYYYLCHSGDVSLFHFLGNFPRNLFMREENDWTLFLGREGTLLWDRRFTQVCQVVRLPFQTETRMGQNWVKLWIPMTFHLQLNLMSMFWKQIWYLWYDTLMSLFVPFQSTFKFKEKNSPYFLLFTIASVFTRFMENGWLCINC